MHPRTSLFFWLASLCFLFFGGLVRAQYDANLRNGDFERGDLVFWKTFNTPNGGTTGPSVVSFDTAGTGQPSLSAQFQVYLLAGPINGPRYGAGIQQAVGTQEGQLEITLDIAAYHNGANFNLDAGSFELLVDDVVVDSRTFGIIGPGQTFRSHLGYTNHVSLGTRRLAIVMRRAAEGPTNNPTPFQYLDNVRLVLKPVPRITGITRSPTNVVISGTHGYTNGTYHVLAATNLTIPATNWVSVGTNFFDGHGDFRFTNKMGSAGTSIQFYKVQGR